MKKFSLLIALCMLLTIGGVYATWMYSGKQVAPQTEPFISKMGEIGHEGEAGSYTFSNNTLGFAVEPDSQATKITTLLWNNGSITVTFTPKSDITAESLAKALNATITVEQASSSLGSYGGQTIYSVDTDYKVVLDSEKWTPVDTNDDGKAEYYTYVITVDDVDDAISIGAFHLPTETEYTVFYNAIQDVKFRVKVTPQA